MTHPPIRSHASGPWTVDDLYALPDDGERYEIFDGSLLVSPPPEFAHTCTAVLLRDLLTRQAPTGFVVVDGGGVYVTQTKYYIPDLAVIRRERLRDRSRRLVPSDILVAVEVVSPNNPSNDLVLKRHAYATAGIPEYWIVDERERTLTVLGPDGPDSYAERGVARPGEPWRGERPYPVVVDPAEIF